MYLANSLRTRNNEITSRIHLSIIWLSNISLSDRDSKKCTTKEERIVSLGSDGSFLEDDVTVRNKSGKGMVTIGKMMIHFLYNARPLRAHPHSMCCKMIKITSKMIHDLFFMKVTRQNITKTQFLPILPFRYCRHFLLHPARHLVVPPNTSVPFVACCQ